MSAALSPVAVVGAGAVGCYFGAMLARAGHAVTLIGRPAHVDAVQRDGLRLDKGGQTEFIPMAATTELAAVRDAALVLFCVKSTDTESVARQIAPLLAEGAVLMSLQNGVDNAQVIARQLQPGRQTVVPTVVYVATSMPAPGCVQHHGRGDLVIGALAATQTPAAALQSLGDAFGAAGVPVRISADVAAELWAKLLVNCAYNAISGLAQTAYAPLVAVAEIRDVQRAVVHEVIAVAAAEGVHLSLQASLDAVDRIAATMAGQLSSTAQDMARRKPSEIDHLNGHVARRGRALGVPAPVNQTLHALVKLVEAGYPG